MKYAWLNHSAIPPSVPVHVCPCSSVSAHVSPHQSVSVRERPCQSTATKNNKLIIFFAGWGMDATPFSFLDCEDSDVLMIFDYTDDNNLETRHALSLLDSYRQVDLIAWSLGVAVANEIMHPFKDKLHSALAINGSIMPIHDNFGISPDIFQATIENLLNGGIAGFYRRMCKNPAIRKRFTETLPNRAPDDLKNELIALYNKLSNYSPESSIFTHALVCSDDKIMPPDNQAGCWSHFNVPYSLLKAPHFPFYEWSAWREIICQNIK